MRPAQMSPKRSDIFGLGEKLSKLNDSSQILFFEIKAKFQRRLLRQHRNNLLSILMPLIVPYFIVEPCSDIPAEYSYNRSDNLTYYNSEAVD